MFSAGALWKGITLVALGYIGGTSLWAQDELLVRFEPGCEELRGFFTRPAGAVSTTWDFGDGTTSTATDPVHPFPYGQPIAVTVVAVDAFGEQQTYTQSWPAVPRPDLTAIELPTVFTPNGDGVNDTFGPIGLEDLGPCTQLTIWNRFGQVLFRSEGNDITWDGRSFAGEMAVPGVYFYAFTAGGPEWTGHLTLLR